MITDYTLILCMHIVLPPSVQLNTTEAVVNGSFNATCSATGYPAPKLNVTLDCETDALFQRSIRTDNYTMEMLILINQFPTSCSIISCYSYPVNCTQTINHTIAPTTAPTTDMEPTPTSTTVHPIISIVPTNHTGGAPIKATSTITILLLILTVLL